MKPNPSDLSPNSRPSVRLAECLRLVAQRGDIAYIADPGPGEFAVLDLDTGTKSFYAIPRRTNVLHLSRLVEAEFCASAERIEEFVWTF